MIFNEIYTLLPLFLYQFPGQFILFYLFIYLFIYLFSFLGLQPWHMEVPRLVVELEL